MPNPVPTVDEYVDLIMAARPPLSPQQLARLRVLLAGRRPKFPDAHQELDFREDQAAWDRRADAALRLPPLESGDCDPMVRRRSA